jgi:putative aldouronate transport system permease protein
MARAHITSSRYYLFDVINYIILVLIIIVMMYPLVLTLGISFSSPGAVMAGKVKLLPIGFNADSYQYVLQNKAIIRAYMNTLLYASVSLVLTLTFTAMIAYPLSLDRFAIKNIITVFITIPMFIGGGLIPYYIVVQKLGMIDTIWAMVLPCVGTFDIIIFRIFFKENGALTESAYIDGANDWVILFRIIMPLSKPVLATIGLFTVVAQWNNFFNALIFLNNENLHPIQMYIRKIMTDLDLTKLGPLNIGVVTGRVVGRTVKAATIMVTILPILVAYPIAQKYFVRGMRIGSIKG